MAKHTFTSRLSPGDRCEVVDLRHTPPRYEAGTIVLVAFYTDLNRKNKLEKNFAFYKVRLDKVRKTRTGEKPILVDINRDDAMYIRVPGDEQS